MEGVLGLECVHGPEVENEGCIRTVTGLYVIGNCGQWLLLPRCTQMAMPGPVYDRQV